MLDRNGLRAAIVRRGMTQKEVAAVLGISEKTFINRMKRGVFGTDEVERLIELLGISNPIEIFFARRVT